jgi:hypothetical protein
MLMATELLKRRLSSIKQARAAAGLKDTTPTLLDIERTHVLFMNAHFKPFAAIGFEYHKVNPDSGGATLGSEVRFSIPQFGDFFNDMALYVKFKKAVYTPVIAAPNQDVFRYCDYPGERLLQKVKFDVNGNPLDEYTSDVYNFHRQFNIQPNKRVAWDRLVGQETPHSAYLEQASQVQPSSRVKVDYCDGHQTPKGTHDALVVMVPLLFWFNKDPRLAVPSVSIPYGQRFLNITLAKSSELIELVTPPGAAGDTGTVPVLEVETISLFINNIFVNPEVHDIFIKRIGFTLIRVHRLQTTRVKDDEANILLNNMKWPIEAMFVAIKPIANTQDAESLQNWHRFSKVTASTTDVDGVATCKQDTVAQAEVDAFLLVTDGQNGANTAVLQLAEYAALGKTSAAGAALYALAAATAQDALYTANAAGATFVFETVQLAADAAYMVHATKSGECAKVEVHKSTPTVDKLSITAHGIDIYKEMPGTFFNSYTPYTFGGHNVSSPEDPGALMITFCLYPGSYQPSGHVNVSRAREFYLKYWAANASVSTDDPADLIIVASAINFLFNKVLLLIVYSLTQTIKVHIKVCASVIWFSSMMKNPMCQIMRNRQIAGNSRLIL